MSAIARGGTTVADNLIPRAYQAALEKRGLNDQRQRDALTQKQTDQAIREIKEEVGEGNARRLPLGRGAVAGRTYRTEANRSAVGAWLFRYFAETFEVTTINIPMHRGESATGAELHPKTITAWDVDIALANLSYARHDLYDLLIRRYKWDIKLHEIARADHRGRKTIGELHREALNLLVDELWRDLG